MPEPEIEHRTPSDVRTVIADMVASSVESRAKLDDALLRRLDDAERRQVASEERYAKLVERLIDRHPGLRDPVEENTAALERAKIAAAEKAAAKAAEDEAKQKAWTRFLEAIKAASPILLPVTAALSAASTAIVQYLLSRGSVP